MFHIHRYSDWATIETGTLIAPYSDRKQGTYIIQEKFCLSCKRAKIRLVKTSAKDISYFTLHPRNTVVHPHHDRTVKG